MSFAGKLGRGLLQGLAGYYGELAEEQEWDRRSAILQQREEALEALRQSGRSAGIESLGGPDAAASSSPPRPGDISADGRSRWDGHAWVPLNAAQRFELERLARNGK